MNDGQRVNDRPAEGWCRKTGKGVNEGKPLKFMKETETMVFKSTRSENAGHGLAQPPLQPRVSTLQEISLGLV